MHKCSPHERSDMRDAAARFTPDFACAHPGYGCLTSLPCPPTNAAAKGRLHVRSRTGKNHRRRVREARRDRAGDQGRRSARRSRRRSTCSTAGRRASPNAWPTAPGKSINGSRRRCCCRSASPTTCRFQAVPAHAVWWDKVPSKFDDWDDKNFRAAGFRAVPGCVVRRSAYIAPGRGADAVVRQSRRLCGSKAP